ncbi:hypothetical protein KIN20_036495 [Parelaphostrongylus tenuis]|nr:hypothetical protein KIN20_036495 [Parelaphostrongylus tenuis]
MTSSTNSPNFATVKVEVDEAEPDGTRGHRWTQRIALNSGLAVIRLGNGDGGGGGDLSKGIRLRYDVREPNDSTTSTLTTPAAPKKIIIGRPSLDSKCETRTELGKEIGKLGQQAINQHAPKKTSLTIKDLTGSSVKLWRTPSGKLVRLCSKLPVDRSHAPVHGLVSSQPKFIRLSNGKLAKITKKRILRPVSQASGLSGHNAAHSVVRNGNISAPTATARVTASSEPINIYALMKNAHSKQSANDVKTEPMEVDEAVKQAQSQHARSNNDSQLSQRLSIASDLDCRLLNGVTTLPQGDLLKQADRPLFNDETRSNVSELNCSVCRTIIPAMKANLLSLEARLGALVENVQNLLIYLNPNDRRTLEVASMISNNVFSVGNITNGTSTSTSSSKSAGTASCPTNPPNGSENAPPYRLPVAVKADKPSESRTYKAAQGSGPQLSSNAKVVRSVLMSPSASLKKQSVSSPRIISFSGGTRFVVANRADALQTACNSNILAKATKSVENESCKQSTQLTIKAGEDTKPETSCLLMPK